MMKSNLAVGPLKWSGRALLAPGLAVFAGRTGHQDWHHHQANQIAIGGGVEPREKGWLGSSGGCCFN